MDNAVDYKIKVENVTKEYELFKTQSEKLRSFFALGHRHEVPHFWSLMGISFKVKPGETLGLIGVNGSGKSTLSNIISGVIPQTTGQVDVRGDTSIIAIGAGLRGNLTGIENIRLKALMQGLTNSEIDAIMTDIVNFADIGDFLYQPVKSYSSGMKSRLGFAIAVHVNPDVIIIDEALSVGDDTFYQKCVAKINEFKEEGKTIVFVSHNMKQVKILCDRVAWIHYGTLKEIGETQSVVDDYQEFTKWFKGQSKKDKKAFQRQMKDDQKSFSIDNYEKQVAEEREAANPEENPQAITAAVHKDFYGSVLSEKMSVANRILTWVVLFAFLFLCGVNISGHSMSDVVAHPSQMFHVVKTLHDPNATKSVK
ncbi:teichoic acids export ABC transporter ATP-binding subunit TagH [Levilactobacillus bambusae]|uniref:Teichoic acids export ABC transporter ATP-binding subunit TagH n=1 Tax=Levilactobacillus bambusae TaxID=2024736 RepID=A0A2V1MZ92_9LACO|nr:teichoic acids export ABC transporter ATP-binding subunit TagH [Levilactobacillus bambusae]PWF99465.1 teichoic acids export ABC transporter ATP-binding subunit TagH [Levilactobacillus bambusae]